jgi:hypothetical protein
MHILGGDEEDEDAERPVKKPRQSTKEDICKHCGKKGHTTTRSKQCLKHKDNLNQQQEPAVAAVAEPQVDDGNDQSIDQAEDLDRYEALLLEEAGNNTNNTDDATNMDNDRDVDVQILPII